MSHLNRSGFTDLALVAALLCALGGCANRERPNPWPDPPDYAPDHAYTLDELIELSVHRNASLDVARFEAEAVQGLVDQVKALWLPSARFDFAATAYQQDVNYDARAFDLVTINIPITGAYNIINSLNIGQILFTGGKRTSGLKQAKMFAAIKKLEVLRQQDMIAFDVANYYYLVCLTNDLDVILEDALRRIRVFNQVAEELNRQGSLRASNLDHLQAKYFISQIEQLQVAVRAGRTQAYEALRQAVGIARDQPLLLKSAALPAPVGPREVLSGTATIARAFLKRPEIEQVNLFTKIRSEQVTFAKALWMPNIVLFGSATDIQGNHHALLNSIDGLLAGIVVDIPIYDPARRGKLREALGLEQASLAFQRQVEELITLESQVTAIDAQKTLVTAILAARARKIAADHYEATRQAYSRELVPAAAVVTAIGLDMLAKAQHVQALYAFHNAKARLKRVTADRESQYGF